MRSWEKYCEDTEKAFVHFRDCIWQPVYITGYLSTKHSYLFQVNYRLHPYWDSWVTIKVHPSGEMAPSDLNMSDEEYNYRFNEWSRVMLRGMDRDTVFASTEMRDIHRDIFNDSKRYTGIPNACGMRKPINRLGNAFNWPNVSYRNILPL
jgi:hypothetical protein